MPFIRFGARLIIGNARQVGDVAKIIASSPSRSKRFRKLSDRRKLAMLFHASPFGVAGRTTTHRKLSQQANQDLKHVQRGK